MHLAHRKTLLLALACIGLGVGFTVARCWGAGAERASISLVAVEPGGMELTRPVAPVLDRAVVPVPRRVPVTPALPTPSPPSGPSKATATDKTSDTPVHQVVRQEFGYWLALAEESGVSIPRDFVMPADLHAQFAAAHSRYEGDLKTIDAARMPILDQVMEWKRERGYYEEFEAPDPRNPTDPKSVAFRKACRPTGTHQVVITSGAGKKTQIIRVDAADHQDLPHLYAASDKAKKEYVESFYVLLAPYLKR